MAVTIKSEKEIALMRESGRLLAIVHDELGKAIRPGMTTKDIDRLGEEIIRSFGCTPRLYTEFQAKNGIWRRATSSAWMRGSSTKVTIPTRRGPTRSARSAKRHRN